MNKYIILGLFCIGSGANAQTNTKNNCLNFGFGFQQYNGDLGNTFFATDEEWYGVGRISYSRKINASFHVNAFATMGDFGHCFDGIQDVNNPIINMRSRLNTAGLAVQYNFANGIILSAQNKFNPYIYTGLAMNSVKDIWSAGTRVNNGNYSSLNYGLGFDYQITRTLHSSFNMAFGRFNSDKLDYISKGGNDMYMQNTLSIGVDF